MLRVLFRSCLAIVIVLLPLEGAGGQEDYQVVKEKAEWEPRALKHADLEEFYRQNLYPVMEVFASRVRAPSAFGIAHMAKKYGNNARLRRSTAVIVVRSGKLQAITYPDFNPLFSLRVDSVVQQLQRFVDEGFLTLEDTIFLLNPRDVALCMPHHAPNQIAFTQYCVVPIFSFVKERHNEKDYNDDLLVPQLAYPQDGLVYYPEGKQADKAVFRAYRHPASMSSCKGLVIKLARSPLGEQFLDAELVSAPGDAANSSDADIAPVLPRVEALSAWRYVMSCDTQTANVRFARMLHLNSLVLKGASSWIEYFYGMLKDGEHFLEFNAGFAVEAVKKAQELHASGGVARIVENAQRFAYRYLSPKSRALYYERAIQEYNKLFGAGYMQATVAALPKGRPLGMDDILALKMYPPGWSQHI